MPWYENRKGETLWYEERGTGCPLVLVHGWCMSSAVWKYQFDGLADSFRLLAPDLRGHGRSGEVAANLSFDSFAEDLIDLFDCLELARAVLLGWSMGAQIALQAYAGLSGRLAGLVLVSATPRFTATDDFLHALVGKEAGGMRIKVQRNTRRALDDFFSRLFAEGELESNSLAQEIIQLLSTISAPDTSVVLEALDSLSRADMRHRLAAIAIPTLIVNGAQDRICLPQASAYLKTNITDAEQTVFHDCGHTPFLTYSDKFNAEIFRFARSVSEQSA